MDPERTSGCMVEIPPALLMEIDTLVGMGVFTSRDGAVAELLRVGIDAMKSRNRAPRIPPRPPAPPGVNEPGDDMPISVDPSDVQWIE